MKTEDVQVIEKRRAHFSNIIVEQNRKPKYQRDERLLSLAKKKNATLSNWLKDLKK